jgi:toxin-antitoxin system PIN domain toxin
VQIVDTNILLYAANASGPHHERALRALGALLGGDEMVGVPMVAVLGFLRIATNPRIFPEPLAVEDALNVIDDLLAHPRVAVVNPGDDHWKVLRELISTTGVAGNVSTDAHIAALAIERGAAVVSHDSDFSRFKGLRWENPF